MAQYGHLTRHNNHTTKTGTQEMVTLVRMWKQELRHECVKGIEELRNGCEVWVMHFSPSLEKVTGDENKFPSGVAEFNLDVFHGPIDS